MRCKLISYKVIHTKKTDDLHEIYFDDMRGKTYHTYTSPAYRNYGRWKSALDKHDKGAEIWLDNLSIKNEKKRLVSADSAFYFFRVSEI